MAKPISIKFPRIIAGFYGITFEGEFVGYVMREVGDDKETNWYVFDNATPDLDVAMLDPKAAIDAPDTLFREAKDSARAYFLAKPAAATPGPLTVAPELDAEPAEEAPEADAEADAGDWDLIEDDNLFVSEDGDLELFEDELEPLEGDLEFDTVEAGELALV